MRWQLECHVPEGGGRAPQAAGAQNTSNSLARLYASVGAAAPWVKLSGAQLSLGLPELLLLVGVGTSVHYRWRWPPSGLRELTECGRRSRLYSRVESREGVEVFCAFAA